MRRVAEELGASTMSLYTYVPGKAELLDLMVDTVFGETARPDGVPGGWRGRLEQIAHENAAVYRRHPWLLQVATARPPLGPHTIAKYDWELRALDGCGLTDVEMDSALTLVLGWVQSAMRGLLDAEQAARHSGQSDVQWWEAYAPLLDHMLDPARFPSPPGWAPPRAKHTRRPPTRTRSSSGWRASWTASQRSSRPENDLRRPAHRLRHPRKRPGTGAHASVPPPRAHRDGGHPRGQPRPAGPEDHPRTPRPQVPPSRRRQRLPPRRPAVPDDRRLDGYDQEVADDHRARFARWLAGNGASTTDPDAAGGLPARALALIPRAMQPHADRVDSETGTFVGPCLGTRSGSWTRPSDVDRVVLVSLGSAFTPQPGFSRECLRAFGNLPGWHVVLQQAAAFVTHAGMGGSNEGLATGVPMIAVPQAAAQFRNADRLVELGVARRIDTADRLRRALLELTADPEVARRCARLREQSRTEGGTRRAADLVEEALG